MHETYRKIDMQVLHGMQNSRRSRIDGHLGDSKVKVPISGHVPNSEHFYGFVKCKYLNFPHRMYVHIRYMYAERKKFVKNKKRETLIR